MNDSGASDQALMAEVRQWVSRLLASAGQERVHAASELGRLGVWSRGSVRTRGSLRAAPPSRLPEPEKLQDLVRCLRDTDARVRCQVALALGEWGGEEAAAAVGSLLGSDPNEEVQLYCVTALRLLGGPTATEALRQAVERGTDAVRDAALNAITELVTGGSADDTEGPLPPSRPVSPAAEPGRGERVREAVRTRGATRGARAPAPIESLRGTLERIRADDTVSAALRHKAQEVLAYLPE